MNKITWFLKLFFYFSLLLLVIASLFPGSLAGLLVFNDIGRPPNLVDNPIYQVLPIDYYNISAIINHFAFFFFTSILGFSIYSRKYNFQKLVYVLFSLSIFLEVIQVVIPNRVFEIYDVSANFAGVLFAYLIIKIYKFYKKNNE